jgi:hypothetical protein
VRVEWSAAALADLEQIAAYIEQDRIVRLPTEFCELFMMLSKAYGECLIAAVMAVSRTHEN